MEKNELNIVSSLERRVTQVDWSHKNNNFPYNILTTLLCNLIEYLYNIGSQHNTKYNSRNSSKFQEYAFLHLYKYPNFLESEISLKIIVTESAAFENISNV